MTRDNATTPQSAPDAAPAVGLEETDCLTALTGLSRAELVAQYEGLFGRPPPSYAHPQLLLQAVAYRSQAQRSIKNVRAVERRLQRLAEQLRTTGSLPVPDRPPVKPGTRLLREWEGETHAVTVTKQGFLYRDEIYGSLSVIARAITGTRWSGPAFFGLRDAGIGARPA